MGRRLIIGLLKGLLIGGAVGALLHFGLGITIASGPLGYALYALVGALSGALAGRAPWKQGAWIAALLKAAFGVAVGCGLYALAKAFVPYDLGRGVVESVLALGQSPEQHSAALVLARDPGFNVANVPMLFAPALAMLYATLVELDDGGEEAAEPVSRVRATNADELLASIPDEEEAAPAAKAAKRKG